MTTRRLSTARSWTYSEHHYLKLNYGILKRTEIARNLKRSIQSIESRARRYAISGIANRKAAGLFGPPRSMDRHLSPAKHAQACLKRYHEHKDEPEYQARLKAAQDRYRAKGRAEKVALGLAHGMARTGITHQKQPLDIRGWHKEAA